MKFLKICLLSIMLVAASVSTTAQAKIGYVYEETEAPQGILNFSKFEIYPGMKVALKLSDAKAVKWSSNCKDIATVSKKGKVTAIAPGTCNVSVVDENGKVYTCTVTVKAPELNKPKGALMYSESSFNLELFGATAVSWKSSDTNVVKVSAKGKVTAQKGVKNGTAIITCTDKKGNVYECKITVLPKSEASKSATREDVQKVLGDYWINTIYTDENKVFMYYATNGAFGDAAPLLRDIADIYYINFPSSTYKSSTNCVLQFCSGVDVNNWCDYSLYYTEYVFEKQNAVSEGMPAMRMIDSSVGDTYYNYFDETQLKKKVKLTKKNFPDLYNALLEFDLNSDGWLCEGEVDNITTLDIAAPIENLKGINYFKNLSSLNLSNYIGKKINLKKNTSIKDLNINANTTTLKVDAPNATYVGVDKYWQFTFDGMVPAKVKTIDLSGCTGATTINAPTSNSECTVKLPAKA